MPIVQTRVFRRVVDTGNAGPIDAAIGQVQDEVNAFIATLPIANVLGVDFSHDSAVVRSQYNSWFVITATVAYVQE